MLEERAPVKRAIIAWLCFGLLAVGSFYEAVKLPFGRTNAPGAGFFPVILAVLLGLMSLVGLVTAFRGGDRENEDGRLVWNKIIFTATALLVFAFVFEFFGYLLTTFLFVIFVLWVVERKSMMQAGVVALCASLISYLLFSLLLGAPLPAGFLPV